MARLRGRSKEILEQAEQRLHEAEAKLENKRNAATAAIHDLETEQAVVNAIRIGYDALRQSFTTPRQPSKATVGKRGSKSIPKATDRCARKDCNAWAANPIHNPGQSQFDHLFVRPTPPTAAPKRIYERCTKCNTTKGNGVHKNKDRADFHPFQPAQPAGASSSPNNGAESSTASSETPQVGAPDVARASSGGE